MACIRLLTLIGIIYCQDDHYFINDLEVEGNKSISKNEILFIVRQRPPNFFFRSPKFDPRLLRLDALTLKNYYYSKGFLDVVINESYHIKDNSNKNKLVDTGKLLIKRFAIPNLYLLIKIFNEMAERLHYIIQLIVETVQGNRNKEY